MNTAQYVRGLGNGRVMNYIGPDPVLVARHAREARAAMERLISPIALTMSPTPYDFYMGTLSTAKRVVGQLLAWGSGIANRNLEPPLQNMIGPEARRVVYFDVARANLPAGQLRDLEQVEWALVIQDFHDAKAAVDRTMAILRDPLFVNPSKPWGVVSHNLGWLMSMALADAVCRQHPGWTDGLNALRSSPALLARSVDLGQVLRMRNMTPNDVGSPHHPVGQHLSRENYVPPARWCL
jgi:hypothetical protein